MNPGIGLMDRRLKTEKDAISLAMSGILKNYKTEIKKIETLETKYDDDAGDWYVALGWEGKRAIVKMDSVLAKITEIKEILTSRCEKNLDSKKVHVHRCLVFE